MHKIKRYSYEKYIWFPVFLSNLVCDFTYYMDLHTLWIHIFYEFTYSFLLNIRPFFNFIGVDSIATKEAKNWLKTDQDQKRKLELSQLHEKLYQGKLLHPTINVTWRWGYPQV